MAERAKRKRPFEEDDDPPSRTMEKKPRFPKGKKVKRTKVYQAELDEDNEVDLDAIVDLELAAMARANRRNKMRGGDVFREHTDISADEINYDESADLEDDGIQLEPFNLNQEREEGYFDENENYVEFASRNEIKDAWLDSAVVDSSFAKKHQKKATSDEEYHDLSTEDIGKIKRSIANVLQRGETIIQALKRLKGTGGDRKARMPEATKHMFDQLTEGAMKLMENGEYNVYNEEREIFEREAEGYERIARARAGTSVAADNEVSRHGEDIVSNDTGHGASNSSISLDHSEASTSLPAPSSDGDGEGDGDQFDMFGDDEDNNNVNVQSNANVVVSGSVSEQVPQPGPEGFNLSQDLYPGEASHGVESDFVYDTSSGYYYSSSLGYYYDPVSTLYCSATTGKWYQYNEQSGEYVEFQNSTAAEN